MPLYDFRCNRCHTTQEMLARIGTTPACPTCGEAMEKLVSAPQAPGKSAEIIAKARASAAREGHFSNYSRSERPRNK